MLTESNLFSPRFRHSCGEQETHIWLDMQDSDYVLEKSASLDHLQLEQRSYLQKRGWVFSTTFV